MNKPGSLNWIELNVANALWAQEDHPFLSSFLNSMQQDYAASIAQTNFSAHAEDARKAISDWTSAHAANRIGDILPPGTVNPATRMSNT